MSWQRVDEPEPDGEDPGWSVVGNVSQPETGEPDGSWELVGNTPVPDAPPPEWQYLGTEAPASDWDYVGNTGELSTDDSHEPGCRCCEGPEPVVAPHGDWNQVGNIRGPAGPPGPVGPPGGGYDDEHDVNDLTLLFNNGVI